MGLPKPPPHHSLNASGDFNGYYPYHQPRNHRSIGSRAEKPSAAHASVRVMATAMHNAHLLWHDLAPLETASWKRKAKQFRLPLFLAFLKINLDRAAHSKPLIRTPNP